MLYNSITQLQPSNLSNEEVTPLRGKFPINRSNPSITGVTKVTNLGISQDEWYANHLTNKCVAYIR